MSVADPRPQAEHTCVVCVGSACYDQGADVIATALADEFGIIRGKTTPDRRLSVTKVHCLGNCELAPVIEMDGQLRGHETPDGAIRVAWAALKGKGDV